MPISFSLLCAAQCSGPSVGTCRACVGGLGHTVGVIRVRVSAVHGCSPQQSQPDEQENATKFAFQFPCSIFVKLRCVEDASQSRSVPIRERNSHFAPSDREFGRRCVLPRPSFTPAGLGEIDQAFPLHPSPTRSLRSIHPAPSSACRITHLLPCPNGTSLVALMAKTKGVWLCFEPLRLRPRTKQPRHVRLVADRGRWEGGGLMGATCYCCCIFARSLIWAADRGEQDSTGSPFLDPKIAKP